MFGSEAGVAILFFLSLAFGMACLLPSLIFLGYALIDRKTNPTKLKWAKRILISIASIFGPLILFTGLATKSQEYEESFCSMVASSDYSGVDSRLQSGQDPNACTHFSQGDTALRLAEKKRDAKMIEMLKHYGARHEHEEISTKSETSAVK